jgi:hypothetical protein
MLITYIYTLGFQLPLGEVTSLVTYEKGYQDQVTEPLSILYLLLAISCSNRIHLQLIARYT